MCKQKHFCCSSLSDKKAVLRTGTHKEQPETALIQQRPTETEREEKKKEKKTRDKQINTHIKTSKKKKPKITFGKMFLGLLKPIKIKYEREKKKKAISDRKKERVREALLSTVVTQFCRNNKRYLTIAFTVLEEIYFSLPATEKKRAHYTAVHAAETQTKRI